ncbi:MAG: hypothetical protein U0802_04105 [Candidatus Binatia bacterium]
MACPPDAQGLFDHEGSSQNFHTATTYGSAPPQTPTAGSRFLDGLAPASLPGGISFSGAPLLLSGATTTPLALYALDGFGVYPPTTSRPATTPTAACRRPARRLARPSAIASCALRCWR